MLVCQSGSWQSSNGLSDTIDTATGIPLSTCNYNYVTSGFKKVNGIVFGRFINNLAGFDSGWVTLPYDSGSGYIMKQYIGNIYGIYVPGNSGWGCKAYRT